MFGADHQPIYSAFIRERLGQETGIEIAAGHARQKDFCHC